jgi:glutamate/tyrosine decarboxylase-like PLP-dependent enzyme
MDDLRHRKAPVQIDPEEFRAMGHLLVDRIARHFETLAAQRVTSGESPAVLQKLLGVDEPLPRSGSLPGPLLDEATTMLLGHSLFNAHPRFWGYITAGPTSIGVLSELLASAVNSNVGAWKLSPMASEIEKQTIRWIAEFIGYPVDCGGLMVSGGNMANFICFLAARRARAGWDARQSGLAGKDARPLRLYASAATHTWIQKAADLFGHGTDAIRWIAVDRNDRLDVEALRRQVQSDRSAGLQPFLVVANAGSVGTGAVDDLPEIGAFCRQSGLWFHVDGAYGAFAALVPGAPPHLAGLKDADSVALDPHKWLYAPLECGCALVRQPADLLNAFTFHPTYYHFEDSVTNYVDFGPQNSRSFRALKVWMALRQAGRDNYRKMIADDIHLAQHSLSVSTGASRIRRALLRAQHHDVSICSKGPAGTHERRSSRDLSRSTEHRNSHADRKQRRGVSVECCRQRQVRSPRVYRQFPDVSGRYRGSAGNCGPDRPTTSLKSGPGHLVSLFVDSEPVMKRGLCD